MNLLVLPTEKNYKRLKVNNLVLLKCAYGVKMYGGTLSNEDFIFLYIESRGVLCGYDEVENVAMFDTEFIIRSEYSLKPLSVEDVADILNWEIVDEIMSFSC